MNDLPPEKEPSHSRRNLFRNAFKKTGEVVLKEAERKVEKASARFVRPPGSGSELEFLATCTRCGDCVPACPHETIFLLGAHTGVAAKTPALDLTNKACHLCEDLPCVAACEPEALKPVAIESLKFATIRINTTTCLPYLGPECGVCVSVCPVPGAITLDLTIPEVNAEKCNGCAICREACIVEPSAITIHPLEVS